MRIENRKEKKMPEQEKKFETKLTIEEIQIEIDKIGAFFKRIPTELKPEAAERFIYEIVNQASYNIYEALGIFDEAKSRYREVLTRILAEEAEEAEHERLCKMYENSVAYKCIVEVDWIEGINVGDVVKAAYSGDDEAYSGGGRYDVFTENADGEGVHRISCKHSFETHFELVE